MVIILVLVSSLLGLGSAVVALVFFDVSLLQGFGLWMSTGFAVLMYAAIASLLPRRGLPEDRQIESA